MSSEKRIVGGWVVPHPGAVLEASEIAFSPSSGLISYLGPVRGPAGSGDVDARGRIVAPGLVNAHTHAAMTLLRGHSDDVPLQDWLGAIRAFELRMTYDDIRAGLALAMCEMIRSGTIGFVDMHLWDAALLADVCAAGMRVCAAPAVFGYHAVAYPRARQQAGTEVLDRTPDLAAEFAGEPLVRVSFGPHAPYSCGPELIGDVAGRAAKNG
ncbi:MAG TPA: amidohydrolase family protein, partial [Nakamurella sp.]|nr:amidohydrolase family protein [Nakamurella sp.]